jgi:hypothetical protein
MDPNNGYTGTNVYGYNLLGDYSNNIPQARYLTTTAINCANRTSVQLRFWRWLGVESLDGANIQVSNNGTTWTNVWQNTTGVADTAWTQQTYDISAVADNHATVYVRWGMGSTNGSLTYPGWNIDDVQIWAAPLPCSLAADVNLDGHVDARDVQGFLNCYIAGTPHGSGCDCADMDSSGVLDATDIGLFVNALLQ